MNEMESIRVDRSLTNEEYELTRWILEHGKPGALQFIEQLDRARVVGGCPCGGASIDFEIDGLGYLHTKNAFAFARRTKEYRQLTLKPEPVKQHPRRRFDARTLDPLTRRPDPKKLISKTWHNPFAAPLVETADPDNITNVA